MHNSNKFAYLNLFQIFTDIFTVVFSFIFSFHLTKNLTTLYPMFDYCWILLIYLPFWILIMHSQEMYNDTIFNYYDRAFFFILKSTILSGVFVVAVIYMVKLTIYSRLFLINFLFFNILFIFFKKILCCKLNVKYSLFKPKRVLIIGTPKLYDKFNYFLGKTNIKYNIINFIDINKGSSIDNNIILSRAEDLEEIIKNYYIDEVIFVLSKKFITKSEKYLKLCENMGITNRVLVDLFYLKKSKTHIGALGTMPMITFHTINLNRLQLFYKRILDISGALIGIILAFIIGIFIAILIKIESSGPVIFSQKRVGLNGRIFNCYKFRSMYPDAEKTKSDLISKNELHTNLMFKMKNDPRITRIGKFIRKTSLDELPQFFNVLKGEMSLVGTRPPTQDEVKNYGTKHRRRISIYPGITGMWQVNGRSNIKDFDKVVKLDTEYIDNWSFFLDLKILFKTIFIVLGYRNGY